MLEEEKEEHYSCHYNGYQAGKRRSRSDRSYSLPLLARQLRNLRRELVVTCATSKVSRQYLLVDAVLVSSIE